MFAIYFMALYKYWICEAAIFFNKEDVLKILFMDTFQIINTFDTRMGDRNYIFLNGNIFFLIPDTYSISLIFFFQAFFSHMCNILLFYRLH